MPNVPLMVNALMLNASNAIQKTATTTRSIRPHNTCRQQVLPTRDVNQQRTANTNTTPLHRSRRSGGQSVPGGVASHLPGIGLACGAKTQTFGPY